jgi:hypothetical protein
MVLLHDQNFVVVLLVAFGNRQMARWAFNSPFFKPTLCHQILSLTLQQMSRQENYPLLFKL